MSERKIRGFTFWESYYETFQKIPNKRDKLLFINCILSYVFDGEMIDVTQNPIIDVAFTGIKSNLDNTIKQALNGQKKKANKKPNGSQTEANSKQEEKEKEKEIKKEKEQEEGEEKGEPNMFGQFGNVNLTHTQYNNIVRKGAIDYIDKLSIYMESTGKQYNNHYATIMRWYSNDCKFTPQFQSDEKEDADDPKREAMLEEFERIKGVS